MDERTADHRRVYDAIAERYDNRLNPRRVPLLGEAFEALVGAVLSGGRVADLGCGPGKDLTRLADAGHAAFGVDLSMGMLMRASERAPGRVAAGDLRRLPLRDGCFDGVWSSYALLHLDDDELAAALSEVARVLRPGGTALLVLAGAGSGCEQVSYAPEHSRRFFAHSESQVAELGDCSGLDVRTVRSSPEQWRSPLAVHAVRRSPE